MEPLVDDRPLAIVGLVLAAVLVGGVVTVALAATSSPDRTGPDADWRFERVNDTHVRIVHAGGEPVSTDLLSVVSAKSDVGGSGVPRHAAWSASVLSRGDDGVVFVGDGSALVLLWERADVERVVLARWRANGSAGSTPAGTTSGGPATAPATVPRTAG